MDHKDHKDISNLELDKLNLPNDYKFLVKKLRSIKDTLNLLEKNLFGKKK